MSRPFCHLHNHTEYSLLDGANRIPDMLDRAKELGMDSLAISDHGVMFGAMEFYLEAKARGIKPILGVEAYVAPQGHLNRTGREENQSFHLLLLARNLEGYRNLCKLSSIAALRGYYYKPRIDHDLLRQHSEGLIGTSTCLGSEVCQELLKGNYDNAQRLAGMYREIFGEGNYFIELQDHRLPEQAQIKDGLLRIAKELKLPLIATNDAHYLCRTDAKPHDVLLCIQTGAQVADEKRMRFATDEFYLKSQEEMAALFADTPEALENTAAIAERCQVELDKQRAPMPQPNLPDGLTADQYLRAAAMDGLAKRMKNPELALDRLNYELDVIERTGFGDYFLLVKEFAQATRDRGIYFGVRGSAAGSLVSYCLEITDVDPVEYDLTFERFLNPERISMPDIDMDFEDARRDEILDYVTERFGQDHVAQIVTFGTLGAKAAIKDSGRVMGYSPQETDRICKTIPTLPGWSIQRALKEVAEFRQMVEAEPRYRALVETALSVEGLARHAGVHAAGVVISREPLVNYVPLYRGNDGQAITAYEMGILEKIGLLKMDFLGLSNLTALARAVSKIKERYPERAENFDIRDLPLDDKKTYEMLGRGETTGVFQLEGGGMTRYVAQLKPEYLDKRMEPILEETYGIIVYQDQVLKLVQALAGFSLGKADVLRRAMGKKDVAAMSKMNSEFMEGAAALGVDRNVAEKVWLLLLPFAGYAFNKAHAVCYSLLAYQTAYLKANYPVEYMAALLSVYLGREDKVVAFIEECRRLKIPVLPPDINHSEMDFSIEEPSESSVGAKVRKEATAIRFGLLAIKGVGEGIVEAIVKDRKVNGPYVHLYEFCERLKPTGLNRTALESLIRAGAFDRMHGNRTTVLKVLEGALQFAEVANRDRLAGQVSLFGEGHQSPMSAYPELPVVTEPSRSELLSMEKEVMGIYVSDHPLRGMESLIRSSATHTCQAAFELEEGESVKLAGVLAGVRTMVTKKTGEKMATLILEDFTGQFGLIVFPATFAKLKDSIHKDQVVQIQGVIMHRERAGEKSVELRVEQLKPLDPTLDFQLATSTDSPGAIVIELHRATEAQIVKIKELIDRHPGDYEVMLQVLPYTDFAPIPLPAMVQPDVNLLKAIEQVTKAKVELREYSPARFAGAVVQAS